MDSRCKFSTGHASNSLRSSVSVEQQMSTPAIIKFSSVGATRTATDDFGLKIRGVACARTAALRPEAVVPVKSVFDPKQLCRCVLLRSEPREPELAVAGTASQRLLANQPHRVAVNASRLAPRLLFAAMTGLQTGEFHALR